MTATISAKINDARARLEANRINMVKVAQEINAWTVVVSDIKARRNGTTRPDPFAVQKALGVISLLREEVKDRDTAAAYRFVEAEMDAA